MSSRIDYQTANASASRIGARSVVLGRLLTLLLVVGIAGLPAWGWGDRTQLGIVNMAMHTISRGGSIPLDNLKSSVIEGASASDAVLGEFIAEYGEDSWAAVESQMQLLQSVRTGKVDDYFAYRLGVLGQILARATAPMASAPLRYRRAYYNDVDAAIDAVSFDPRAPRVVQPEAFFTQLRRDVANRTAVIESEYRGGGEFNATVRTTLPADIARSINAVCDVWYTLLTSSARGPGVSEEQRVDFLINALSYYLDKDLPPRIDSTYARLMSQAGADLELRQRIGNLFYDAGQYERAMQEYAAVLDKEPNNREVVAKVASYYVEQGDEALDNQQLEQALEFYEKAVDADALHPTAQRKVFSVEKLIEARNARFARAQSALDRADQLQREAEQQALRRDVAQALSLLEQARDQFLSVDDEFAVLAKAAQTGLRDVQYQMREMKQTLISNAQSLSGTGFIAGIPRQAARADEPDKEALQQVTAIEQQRQIGELQRRLGELLQPIQP